MQGLRLFQLAARLLSNTQTCCSSMHKLSSSAAISTCLSRRPMPVTCPSNPFGLTEPSWGYSHTSNRLTNPYGVLSSLWLQSTRSYGRKRRQKPLSIRRLNNKASWQAIQPYLKTLPPNTPTQQKRPKSPVIDTVLPPLPAVQYPSQMQRIGRITGPYTVPSKQAFAVIEFPGTFQYKVTPDDIIFVNKLNGVDINDVLALGRVMLIGTPTVSGLRSMACLYQHCCWSTHTCCCLAASSISCT